MSWEPLVSVVVPTFNRLLYLQAAINSVFAQTFQNWELIIADDGSTGETRAYLEGLADPRIRTIWLSHSGNPSIVRNAGIRAARGDYVAFLDSDDVWTPQKLEKQLIALRARPDRRWSYTACDRIRAGGEPLSNERLRRYLPHEGWILEPMLKIEVMIAMPTVLVERTLIAEIGGFDEEQSFCEYYDLCLRFAMRSAVVAVAEPLCSIRADNQSYSTDRVAEYDGWIRLYGKMAKLVGDPRLKGLCRRLRAERALGLARLHADTRNLTAVCRTLLMASRFSWPYPAWWLGAFKAMARPFVPRVRREKTQQTNQH